MATKTITIDIEAYRRLKTVQRENESFSQTIKRVVPKPVSTEELIRFFRRAGSQLSEGFFEGVESAVAARDSQGDRERVNGMLGHNRATGSGGTQRTSKAGRRRGKAKAA